MRTTKRLMQEGLKQLRWQEDEQAADIHPWQRVEPPDL